MKSTPSPLVVRGRFRDLAFDPQDTQAGKVVSHNLGEFGHQRRGNLVQDPDSPLWDIGVFPPGGSVDSIASGYDTRSHDTRS